MKSIRFYLVLALLSTVALGNFVAVVYGYRSSMQQAQQLMDTQLADTAVLLQVTGRFALGATEVTIGQWQLCLQAGGCKLEPAAELAGNPQMPMANLSWDDAQEYIRWLSTKTGRQYRLPSEAEWEYAARAGTNSVYSWGNDAVGAGLANCADCGSQWDGKGPAPVASFQANPFGLYDMHGNLWEWTQDCWNRSYKGAPADGSAWEKGDCLARVQRGGAWRLDAEYMRTTRRGKYDRDVRYYLNGFRVARDIP